MHTPTTECIYTRQSITECINTPSLNRGLGWSKADFVVAHVEFGVVRTDEHISQNPQRAVGRRDIDASKSAQTYCPSLLGDLCNMQPEGHRVGGRDRGRSG